MARYVCGRGGIAVGRLASSIFTLAPTGTARRAHAQMRIRGCGRGRMGAPFSGLAVITLAGANCNQANSSGTGVITLGINLAGANCSQVNASTTGAVTVFGGVVGYATALQFIRKYGLAETTQFLADEQNLLTSQLLLDVIAGTWSGTPSGPEKAAAIAALARFTRQAEVSSNFMDGYLAGAVTLPIAPGNPFAGVLEDCCLALMRCGLADDSDNATERMDDSCKTWRAWLKDVQAARVTLTAPDGAAVPARSRIRTGPAQSGLNWNRFGGMR